MRENEKFSGNRNNGNRLKRPGLKTNGRIISLALSNLSCLSVPLWPIRSCTDSAKKISGTNSNEDLSTPAITRDSAEIFRFRGIIWTMPKKDFPVQLLRPGMKSQLLSGSFLPCANSKNN